MINDFTPRKLPVIGEKYKLQSPASPVEDESEIEQLKDLLFLNLEEHGGIGLSANQLGIDRRMCVVNVREPFAMVNPELVAMGGRTVYIESCLSFPSQRMKTERYVEVEVQCDNYDGTLVFGPEPDSFEPETVEDLDDPMILESVAVQHEIDHLNGVTIHDRKATANQPASANDYGRNDVVVFERGSESVEIKWKHRNKLEEGFEPVGRP